MLNPTLLVLIAVFAGAWLAPQAASADALHNRCTVSHLEYATRPVCAKWNGPTCVYNGPDEMTYKTRVCDAYACDHGYVPTPGQMPSSVSACVKPAEATAIVAARAEAARPYSAAEIRDREAACQSNPANCLEIADLYKTGAHGVPPNRAKVMAFSERGCQAKDYRLCGRMADAYTDSGKDQNFEKAVPYLQMACQGARPGGAGGQYCAELAILYSNGRGGILPDWKAAKPLFASAKKLGIGNGFSFAGKYVDAKELQLQDSQVHTAVPLRGAEFPDLERLPATKWYVDDAGQVVRGDPPASRLRR